jgi:hypothetical protein
MFINKIFFSLQQISPLLQMCSPYRGRRANILLPLSILLLLTLPKAEAQQAIKKKLPTHQEVFKEKMKLPKPATMAEGVVEFGKTFLGNPYPKSNINLKPNAEGKVQLQPISQEVLVVNLRVFDCVTFAESMIALAQTRRSSTPNFETFKQNIAKIRYRNAEIDYAARLHYFSDWLFENEKKGILKNITKEIGGEILNKNIFFMSYKKDTLYGNMADPTTYNRMVVVENDITNREKYYIPKEKVSDIESNIKSGDIIGITNRLDGMDMAHVGIAIRQNGRIYMMHASSQFHQVMMTDVPLADYLARNKGQTGIMVGRLMD